MRTKNKTNGFWRNLGYRLLISPYINPITTILVTIIVGILINLITSSGFSFSNKYFIILLIIAFIYILLQIAIIKAVKHKNKKMEYITWFQNALVSHRELNAIIAKATHSFSEHLKKDRKPSLHISFKMAIDIAKFDRTSYHVCDAIYNIISSQFGCPKCQVTVAKYLPEQKKEFIKIIAYKTYQDRTPSSFSIKHLLGTNEQNKRYDVRIFESGSSDVKVLINKKEIQEDFTIDPKSKERQESICQYIGVPCVDIEGKIVFLLQIDVSCENILGKNKEELFELAYNVFVPYVQLLHAYYEQEKAIEIMYQKYCEKINNENINKKTKKYEEMIDRKYIAKNNKKKKLPKELAP